MMTRRRVGVRTLVGAVAVLAAVASYAIDPLVTVSVVGNAWTLAIPILLGALAAVIGERSGVVNIGLEGQMLVGAFAGFFGSAMTGSLLIGFALGLGTGLMLGGFLGWTTVRWGMDQIVAGVVINIVSVGATSFYYLQGKELPGLLPHWTVPVLGDVPLVGDVFFTRMDVFALLALVATPLVHVLLFHTRWGLRTRAMGEMPEAAATSGIDVRRWQVANVTLASTFAAAAGMYLSMEAASTFERGMSAGRGFLALAIVIFGAWRPYRAFAGAMFIGLTSAVASQLQAEQVVDVAPQLINTIPYVLTLIVLAFATRVHAPAALGRPLPMKD